MRQQSPIFPGPIEPELFPPEGNLQPFATVNPSALLAAAQEIDAMKEAHRALFDAPSQAQVKK